ncbi:3-oxoadipate enol-lactonase [Paralimibaculum aggregatum]|uniref:3-oxoadipate enol-lactonase n=1 Tax=Paralimibaculum aggregatum TaxID=3036245 RepID=A0ABQ6LT60_9RHOB|nr:3-oxoadipate enol-lactonase [Limibaculum sp. NKW23]GMG85285.1 3-oxoadipate enol-lactonase [Limibaculum sp. NKW23]
MDAITIGGVTLHYEDSGAPDAPALVFSNSLGTDFRVWDPLLPHLPAGLRRLRYDKRGHGLSTLPAGPWTIADHAADLAGLMDARGIANAVICGLSVGGLIAQELAASRPDLVRALILCDTGAKIGNEAMWNERMEVIRAGGLASILEGNMARWFTAAFRADHDRLAPWSMMLVRTPVEGYLRTAEAIRDADLREQTAGLRLPCLALGGEDDGSTPPDLVRALAALIPGARFELIAGAGHIPCVEQPEALGRLITGFLAEL